MQTHVDNIEHLIEQAISSGLRGPDEIAKAITPLLDGIQEEHLLDVGIRTTVLQHLRKLRVRRETSRRSQRSPGKSLAYESVREVIADGRWQVEVAPGEWKQLRECTAVDLEHVRDAHRDIAARNTAAANRYDALRRLLIEQRRNIVGDLPTEQVVEIMQEKDDE